MAADKTNKKDKDAHTIVDPAGLLPWHKMPKWLYWILLVLAFILLLLFTVAGVAVHSHHYGRI